MTDDTPPGEITRITTPLAMFMLALCGGILMVMSHSVIYGKFGIALAGAAAPIVIIATVTRRFSDQGSAALAFVPVFTALLIGGYIYADLTPTSLILITAAPLFLLPVRTQAAKRLRSGAQ